MSNVLIIEDDRYLLEDLVPLIEFSGHQVTSYTETSSILENLESFGKYDVIILDIMLQRGALESENIEAETGEILAEMIRNYFNGLIVIISAKDQEDINLQFNHKLEYIKKPLSSNIQEIIEYL